MFHSVLTDVNNLCREFICTFFTLSAQGREREERDEVISAGTDLNKSTGREDEDVAAERNRMETTDIAELFKTDSLIVKKLEKFYGTFLAVDRLSLGKVSFSWIHN